MTNASRGNAASAMLVAALLIPRIQRATGVVLTVDDAMVLMGMFAAGWHWTCTVFEKYFPPPNPITPEKPAQETK